ncbi:MAG TPA: metallopeptidase TldD-related protein, partial [Dehalococcoidia bacterium]|nr:metallopeptidase TldD-related protein [Dehalococcoidia bacterium]
LIENGVLKSTLSNHYEMQRILRDEHAREKLGVDPNEWKHAFLPRNGFRFARGGGRHFDAQPGIHPTNVVIPGEVESLDALARQVGDGLYIGRIWYTYPVNGLRAGDFTCTVVGDSYVIRDGRLAEPIKPNTLRINDNIRRVLNGVQGVTRQGKPTLVWAADEIVYAPEIAVEKLELQSIAAYMETL